MFLLATDAAKVDGKCGWARGTARDDCAEASPLGLPGSDEVYNNYVRVPASSASVSFALSFLCEYRTISVDSELREIITCMRISAA